MSRLELVSEIRITPEGKAQADSKAQSRRRRDEQYISRGLQSRPWRDRRVSGGVMQPVLSVLLRASRSSLIRVLVLGLLIFACGDSEHRSENETPQPELDTFTFFDLGRRSLFSERLRDELSEKLGKDAIEHRSIIDLEMNYRGFLKSHLPELDAVNRELNYPAGARVDHDVIKLTYRYARKKQAPFDYIELVFDGRSRQPLVFRIRFKEDEAGTVEALRVKYGSPQVVTWEAEGGRSLVWRKERDYLIVSFVSDQFGIPGHDITMVFTENLEGLIAAEQAAKAGESKGRSAPQKKAF